VDRSLQRSTPCHDPFLVTTSLISLLVWRQAVMHQVNDAELASKALLAALCKESIKEVPFVRALELLFR
jgi:hypothetical protein